MKEITILISLEALNLISDEIGKDLRKDLQD